MKTFLLLLLFATPALAGELASPFALETTKVLPPGVRNPRFINVYTGIDEKFSGLGQAEQLGQPLYRPVTWNLVLKTQDDDAKRATVMGLVQANGLEGKSPGHTTGSVSTFANIRVPALAYGVTSRFTLAVAVPIVNIDVNADTGFVASGDGLRFINAAADSSPALGNEAQNKLNNSVDEKLKWAGMEPVAPFQVRGVGDVQVVSKFLLHDGSSTSFALKETLILPTGSVQANPDRAIDIPTTDDRLGVGSQAIYNQELFWNMTLVGTAGYTAYLPHRIVKRLPDAADDPISRDKEDLQENFRHLVATTAGIEKRFERLGLAVSGGYAGQYQSKVSYEPGLLAQGKRLEWLRNLQPSQTLHSFLATAGFSTVSWYRNKKFFYPFEVKLAYSRPFAGRNATTNELVAAELVLFF
jgi:hypothetical protein